MLDFDLDKMLFSIPKEKHNLEALRVILGQHPEVKFVSFAGLDLAGNDTDERIPIKFFLNDMETLLQQGVQTDGSSVNLPKIAELNNAKVDMLPDFSVNWYVDYNFDNIDAKSLLPVGTLRIPSYLVHNESHYVGSRVILRDAINKFKNDTMELLIAHPYVAQYIEGLDDVKDIEEILVTSATELEFWVRTPDDKADKEELSTSQELKEQYWKRTYGPVRTALERVIEILDYYGLDMEMGHKEVGGVNSKLTHSGTHDHIMEQLEIDWKYSDSMQAADNERLVRYVVRDVFNEFALTTTFKPKPIQGVAGSGEHTHLGMAARLKNGNIINLFNTKNMSNDYLSPIGFGALMGILKNYEAMNPFISSTTNSLKRLKPGFEAPICIVTSLGHNADDPSRNRTVLIGLVKDNKNPGATRFELRSPNPKSNTYLVIATGYMAMLDGMKAAITEEKTPGELEKSISKSYGEEDFYLERDREYRSEKNVFTEYTEEERRKLFGIPPMTVWENIKNFDAFPEKVKAISAEGVIDSQSLDSYREVIVSSWATELHSRNINNAMQDVRDCTRFLNAEHNQFDEEKWEAVNSLRDEIGKNSSKRMSLLSRAKDALDKGDYDTASNLQIEIQRKVEKMKDLYAEYKANLFY